MRDEAAIGADLAVSQPLIIEAVMHRVEHGHIHCECPARLWQEARDRLARDVGPLLARLAEVEAARRVLVECCDSEAVRGNEAEAAVERVEALIDHARKISPSERAVVYVADLERALGREASVPHKTGSNDA